MKIIIAPAKKMKRDLDNFAPKTKPEFLKEAQVLANFLKSQNADQLKALWQVSDSVLKTSLKQLAELDLEKRLTPAIIAFCGIQYQYMAPDLFTKPALIYIQNNLRILSGFYGILRPFDGICPYRLEMKTQMTGFKDYSLYHYWNKKLAESLYCDTDLVINLASKEYSRAISPYLSSKRQLVTITFQERRGDKWRTIATHAKMARGEMVRYLAENKVENLEDLKKFDDFGFKYDEAASSEDNLVFRSEFDFKKSEVK